MAGEDIPRLFTLRAGEQLGQVAADGVQWLDGTITVHWTDDRLPRVEYWDSFEADVAVVALQVEQLTVVWRRQDTYTDQAVPEG